MDITEKLAAALRGIDEACQMGLNSGDPKHWEAALRDIMQDARAALPGGEASEHTPEPWQWEGEIERITGPNNGTIADVTTVANAERIVACVNACAGIPTASLETGTPLRLLAQMHQKG